MMLQILNPDNYHFTLYALPMLITGIAIILFGFFVLIRERMSSVGASFFLMCLSVCLYLIPAALNNASQDSSLSLLWSKIGNLGAIFIPSSVLVLTTVLFGLTHRHRTIIAASIGFSFLFVFGLFFTDLHVRRVEHFSWGNYGRYGPLGYAFMLYFFVIMVLILRLYWQEYRRCTTKLQIKRYRGLLTAFIGGYLGSVDFLAAIGFPVYPFGYVSVGFFIAACTYVITRYQLVDITPELVANQILETMQGAVIVTSMDGRIRVINDVALAMLGHPRSELIDRDLMSILPLSPELSDAVQTGKSVSSREMVWQGRDRKYDVTMSASLLTDTRIGESVGIVYVASDITELKRALLALEQAATEWSSAMDASEDVIYLLDTKRRVIRANRAFFAITGSTTETAIGHHIVGLMHPQGELIPCPVCRAQEDLSDLALIMESDQPDNPAGRPIEITVRIVRDKQGQPVSILMILHDLTHDRKIQEEKALLERQLHQTQKLESIGTLAGGIAHDFNNLLQGVFGYISLAKMTASNPEKSTAALEEAEKALHQSVNLTTQLLTFSKGGKPEKKLIDLRPVIENSVKFTLSGSRSDFRLNIPENLWQTEADGGQLGQVIQNIVLNADQSMPVGGSVSVTAANMAKGSASLPTGLPQGDYVMIAIQDTGVGILEQYLSKIFDPYFTTKEKGSGLGLATSFSIVRNHGGMIDVKTKSGVGTTFMVYLPAVVGHVRRISAEKQQERPLVSRARVLVMDDDEVIRNVSSELLGLLGHDVEVAKHGQEALEKYQYAIAAGSPFDLVILDLTIRGGMGGVETIQQLLNIDPQVKAVVSSGYSDDAATANYLSQGFKAYLKKPYNVDALRNLLNKMLIG